jgi:hypothetical protein
MKAENTQFPHIPWPDPNFETNRSKVPQEELDKYWEQYVAWSWDGTRILLGASSEGELIVKLKEAGIDFQRVVFDYNGPY